MNATSLSPQRPRTIMSNSVPRVMVLALTLAAAPARADQPLWELGIGAGWLHLPHYRGSDQSRDWLLPIPYFVYRGEFFRADREEIGRAHV